MTPQEREKLKRLLAERQRLQERHKDKAAGLPFMDWLPVASPSFTWTWRHQQLIGAKVQEIIDGRNDRLVLSVPPRHGKSEQVTVRLPAYMLERDPRFRMIVGAYSQTLANKFSRKTKKIAEARDVPISMARRAVDDWETDQEGGYRAAGVGAGVTGMGANGVVVDDPVKNRAEANSPTYREKVWDWYTDDIFTRLEPGGFFIVIMTRWHEDDLAGRIIREEGDKKEGGDWEVINLAALALENDPLGRALDEALCPERYDEAALARIQKVLGQSFHALYQGSPVAAEGNLVKRQWFRYYGAAPAPNVTLEIVQSWDTASKASELAAYSVCTTWAITRTGVYLLDVFRDRLEYPALKRAVRNKADQWRPGCILVEDKSSGQALLQELRTETSLPLVAIEPEGDKVTRMAVESVAYESGQVYHPENAPWLADFEAELTTFPLAENADQVDSVSQFLRWSRERAWTFSWESLGSGSDPYNVDQVQSAGWGSVAGGNDFGNF